MGSLAQKLIAGIPEKSIGADKIDPSVYATAEEVAVGTESYKFITPSTLVNAGLLRGRNVLINGRFDIWQRGWSSILMPNPTEYVADRWKWSYGVGGVIDITREEFPLGQTNVPYNPRYFMRGNITTGATGLPMVEQRVESVRTLAGDTVSVSLYVKGTVPGTFTVQLLQSFGSGSVSGNTDGTLGTLSLTTEWVRHEFTYDVPSITGKSLGPNNDDYISLIINIPTSQTGTIDISDVQLETGYVPTGIENRNVGEELTLCQRYYENCLSNQEFVGDTGVGYTVEENSNRKQSDHTHGTTFNVTKRSIPTVIPYSPVTGAINTIRNVSDKAGSPLGVGTNGVREMSLLGGVTGSGCSYYWEAIAEL